MNQGDPSIIQPDAGGLVTRDIPVDRNLFGWHKFTVKFGYQGRRFRDGAFDRDLPPGLHRWWGFFGKYTVSVVDARVHLIGDNTNNPNDRLEAYGTVAGPPGEDQQPTPPCRVVVPLSISIQLADIEAFLSTAKPFSTLTAMIINHTTLSIGQLRYDQLNGWVGWLKSNLERYLQLNSIARTGLQVLEIFVGEPKAASKEDERRLKMFQLTTAIKLESERFRVQREESLKTAQNRKAEADALGISPLLQELLKIPGGVEIIKGDQELRKVAIAAGILTGPEAIIIPINPQGPAGMQRQYVSPAPGSGASGPIQALPGGGGRSSPEWPSWGGSGGFTSPGGPAGPTPTPGNTPPPGVSSTIPMSGYAPPASPPDNAYSAPAYPTFPAPPPAAPGNVYPTYTPPSTSPAPPPPPRDEFDMARISQERSLFPAHQFEIKEGRSIFDDHAGQPTHGYQFILIAKGGDSNNRLTITFDLVPGFPRQAPIVWVKWGQAKFARYGGRAIRDWSEQTWLNDVLNEIVASPLP